MKLFFYAALVLLLILPVSWAVVEIRDLILKRRARKVERWTKLHNRL